MPGVLILKYLACVVAFFVIWGDAMTAMGEPLKGADTGSYAEIAGRPNPGHFTILPVPSLAAILLRAERLKGAPLTRAEVDAIRNGVHVIVVPSEAAQAVEEKRGYKDIEPSRAWEEWQRLRTQFDEP